MAGVHPMGDLAPRDVVAVAMHRRMCASTQDEPTHLYLDATALGRDVLAHRFPSMLAACRAIGIDPVSEPVPVAPGAHYACGGVTADLFGRTSVAGLFAVGEVASTGLHGANRLASNSLTEALVAGRRAGELLAGHLPARGGTPVPTPGRAAVPVASRAATARATSRDAGVLRSADGLERLLDHLTDVPDAATDQLTLPIVEATALHTVSTLVGVAALSRRESRGCHRRDDFPEQSSRWRLPVTLRLVGDMLHVRTPTHEYAA
jgi:L-aspartate oxidase